MFALSDGFRTTERLNDRQPYQGVCHCSDESGGVDERSVEVAARFRPVFGLL